MPRLPTKMQKYHAACKLAVDDAVASGAKCAILITVGPDNYLAHTVAAQSGYEYMCNNLAKQRQVKQMPCKGGKTKTKKGK